MKNIITILMFLPFFLFSQTEFEKAKQLFEQKKYEQARPIFESLLTKNQNDLQIIEYLGDIHGNLKNWDQCINYYSKLKTLKPTEANYFYKYGGGLGMKASLTRNLASLKLVDQAKEAFEKAILLNPKHIEARFALIKIYTELPGFVGGSYKKANKYADELLKISPVDGYLARGIITEYQEEFEKAEINYRTAYNIGKSKVAYKKLYDICIKLKKSPPAPEGGTK
jgi:tetratricopeptide (TPR) repeat protein